jgi:amino acid transporter
VDKAMLAASPIPHVLFGEAAFGRAGLVAMAAVSALASVTSFNAGLMTASRFLYAMARDAAAPRILARLHPDWATPYTAILTLYGFCTALAVYVLWSGAYQLFIFLGAGIECLIFVAMAAAVIRLRRTMPAQPRAYRVPGGTAAAWVVAAVYGLLGFLVFVPDPSRPDSVAAHRGALLILLLATGTVSAYVKWMVPRLRTRAATAGRRRRRPGSA